MWRRAPGLLFLLVIISSFSLAAHRRLSCPVLLALLVLSLLGVLFPGWRCKPRHTWCADAFLLVALASAALLGYSVHDQYPSLDPGIALESRHCGIVEGNPLQEKGHLVFTVRLIGHATGRALPLRMRVFVEQPGCSVRYGDMVVVKGKARIPPRARNPGGFDYREYLRHKGIHYTAYVSSEEVYTVSHHALNPFFQHVLFPAQRYCADVVHARLTNPYSGLLLGLTIGQRGDIPPAIRDLFSDAGIIHILAVSGLHVGILSLFLLLVLRSLRVPFRFATGATCIMIVLYAFLVDLRAPVIRATIMFIFIMLGLHAEKRLLLVNIIACSAVLILIFRPMDIFDPGFQLSYAATFAIVVFHQKIMNWFPRWMRSRRVVRNFLVAPFAVSVSAQLGTLPLVAFHFFRCPLVAPIANITMVPFVFVAIPAGFLMIIANAIHPVASKVLAGSSWCCLHCIVRLSAFFAHLPCAAVWVKRPGVCFFALYYLFICCTLLMKGRRMIFSALVIVLVVLNVMVFSRLWHTCHPRMHVHFLDVGQGDAIVTEFPDGKVAVIDGGKKDKFIDYGARVLLPFLRSRGIRRLSVVIATHPDVDHYGGLVTLIEGMEVERMVVNGEEKESGGYRALLEAAKRKGIPVFSVHRGQIVWIGEYPLYVLHPPRLPHHLAIPSNERSIVIKCGFGDKSVLLTGDYTNDLRQIPSGCLRSQVLKFPHHGARLADARGFLDNVSPLVTVISVGEGNPFGHPDVRNVYLLRGMKSRIYRTDWHGAVTVTLEKDRMTTRTMCE
jgi:competence protein ComEC